MGREGMVVEVEVVVVRREGWVGESQISFFEFTPFPLIDFLHRFWSTYQQGWPKDNC